MGYTKLFEELVKSSIWDLDDKTRIVWITMLAVKDRQHFVRGTVQYLTNLARVSLEDCQKALHILASPDPVSHLQTAEGRRIIAAPGGWQIVNGEYYASRLSQAERAEYKRIKQAEYRARAKGRGKSSRTQAERVRELAVEAGDGEGVRRMDELAAGVAPGTFGGKPGN